MGGDEFTLYKKLLVFGVEAASFASQNHHECTDLCRNLKNVDIHGNRVTCCLASDMRPMKIHLLC